MAFRAGAHVGKVAQQLEANPGRQSWSAIVNADEKSVLVVLEKFQQENVSPPSHTYSSVETHLAVSQLPLTGRGLTKWSQAISSSNMLWVSASSASSVTISGPPSVLRRFFNSADAFGRHVDVTIYAPYHASHLHSDADIERILRPQTRTIFGAVNTYFPVCSSVTGERLEGESALAPQAW